MNYLGLDLSYTGTGIVVLSGDDVLMRRLVVTAPADGLDIERCLHIASEVGEAVMRHKIEVVGVEGYAYGKMAGGEKLGELGGVVKARLHTLGCVWRTVPPQSLKFWVLGKAYRHDEGKRRMVAAARNYGCRTFDDNVADAFWCARWIQDLHTGQREA